MIELADQPILDVQELEERTEYWGEWSNTQGKASYGLRIKFLKGHPITLEELVRH